MKQFMKEIEHRILVHDGSKGVMLQRKGLKGGECGELWNLTRQDAVREIYRSYMEAGSDVIQTNTFPGNRVHLEKFGLGDQTYEINFQGARLAREVAGDRAFVCASIGPTGLLFEPSGELSFERAHQIFSEQVKAVVDGGVDLINFETFTDLAELRAAFFAAREQSDLPVVCSLAFEHNGRTLMGTEPSIAAAVLKAIGADLAGANCSFGPDHMGGIVEAFYNAGGGFLSVKPNAGIPIVVNDQVTYEETPEHFAELTAGFAAHGARLIGGCCGTTPEHIRALKKRVEKLEPVPVKTPPAGMLTSGVRSIMLDALNASRIGFLQVAGFRDALKKDDLAFVEEAALDLASEGYESILVDVDAVPAGMLLARVVDRVQWYVRDPLIIRTKDAAALDSALRIYRGIAGVILPESGDSREELDRIARKYGSVILPSRFSCIGSNT